MLDAGDLDAIVAADPPQCFGRNPEVLRFFEDVTAVERAYVKRTKIFPIMHTLVVRTALLEAHPWLAGNVFNAFDQARKRSLARLLHVGVTAAPIAWLHEAMAQARDALGADPWPYGVDANRPTLDAFLRWAHDQGVCHRLLAPDDLFPAQTLRGVKV